MQAAPIGYNTSETARENYISRTRGGYPDRPRDSSSYGDYLRRGLEDKDPFDPGRFGPKGFGIPEGFKDFDPYRFFGPEGFKDKDPFAPPDRFGIPEGFKDKDPFDPYRFFGPEGFYDPLNPERFKDKDPFDPGRFGVPGFGGLPQEMQSEGIGSLAAVDPSDWRTLEAILGAGGNPDDYIQTAEMGDIDISGGPFYPENEGILQMAELGLPQPMDWQNERLSLDELINLGASEDQIAQYLGVA
jgi:hypothetical protein